MYIIYLSLYIIVLLYFSFFRKKIDVNTLVFLGISVYYFPMFFNKLPILSERGFLTVNLTNINENFLFSLILFISIFLTSTLVYDLKFNKTKLVLNINLRIKNNQTILTIVKYITTFLFLIILILINFNFSLQKTEIQIISGIYMTLYIYFFSLYILFNLHNIFILNQKFDFLFLIIILATLIIFKQRSVVILPMLGFLFYYKFNKTLNKKDIKLFIYMSILLVFMLFSKIIGNYFFSNEIFTLEQINTLFIDAFEPFMINATVNELFNNNFNLDSGYLLKTPLFLIPGLSSLSGIESRYFFDQYQQIIFPFVTFGMAYNPIAESFSTLGYPGIIIFSITVSLMTWIVNILLINTVGYIQLFIAFLSIYIFFYLHRNSLFTEISYTRNFIFIFLIIIIISYFFKNKIIVQRKVKINKKAKP